jgi:hemin uptake protein HemP
MPARDLDSSRNRSRTEDPGQSPTESAERSVTSDSLLQGRSHVSITHNGETYQLRATRLGKLILTK